MITTHTDPIDLDWSTFSSAPPSAAPADESTPASATNAPVTKVTARTVAEQLAAMKVAEIDPALVPYLAAAATELALTSGTSLSFGSDDAPVALLRMIARASIAHPGASGPHTSELSAQLS